MTKSIIDKIRKLRKVAEDGGISEEESALFAEKVAQMLADHGLSMADLRPEEQDDVEEHPINTVYLEPWRLHVVTSLARLYFCDLYKAPWRDEEGRPRAGVVIVGKPHNVEVVKEMFSYLDKTVVRLGREYFSSRDFDPSRKRSVTLSFERGCGEALASRLRRMRLDRATGEKVYAGSNPENLPALYDYEASLVAAQMKKVVFAKKPQPFRQSKLVDSHAAAGILAARDVSLAPQVGQWKHGGQFLK